MEYRVELLNANTYLIEEYDDHTSVYMYLLEGEREAVLIDTGMGTIPLKEICATLTEKPISVILTHGHIDHIGGTYLFEKVFIHPLDLDTYRYHSSDDLRKIFTSEELPTVKEELLWLNDGMKFDLGNRHLIVVHTPGHSVGSVCILDQENRWLFTGDTCCKAHVLLQMEYSTDLKTYEESISRILSISEEFLNREQIVNTWPGHHEKPVSMDIVEQFQEAVRGLMNGTLSGKLKKLPMGECRLLDYKDIGIEY